MTPTTSTSALIIGFGTSLCVACAPPQASVTVAPATFDRSYAPRAWYVQVEQVRPHLEAEAASDSLSTDRGDPRSYSYPRVYQRGFVCGDKPARFVVRTPCAQRVELHGKVWRVDAARCGTKPPVLPVEWELREAILIANLTPVVLWPDRTRESCDRGGARSYRIELLPPVDKEATIMQLWLTNETWAENVYRLEPVSK